MGVKEKRTSKKNVGGSSTSSHDNKKFRTRSMEKQRGMAFGFRKTAAAVKKNPDRHINAALCVEMYCKECNISEKIKIQFKRISRHER